MSNSEDEKIAGSVVAWLNLPWPWPVSKPTTLINRAFKKSNLKITCERFGRLRAEVTVPGLDMAPFAVLSCPLTGEEPPFIFLGASYRMPSSLFLVIDDTVVASFEAPDTVPAVYQIPKRKEPDPSKGEDFAKENAKAIIRRRGTSTGTHPDPTRIPGNDAYVREQLRNEARQVADLLRLLDEGGVHHTAGLATRLRLLVAEGAPLPLLQLAASSVDAPLIVYTCAKPNDPVPMDLNPESRFSLEISEGPFSVFRNPIDLDIWLNLASASYGKRIYTNREVIKAIGNTAGAHIDRDIHPLVAVLRDSKSTAVGGDEYDMLADYVRHLSIITLNLCNQVLEP